MSSHSDFNQETIDWLCTQSDELTKDEGIKSAYTIEAKLSKA